MWEYFAVLFVGFWLGIAIFLYVSCHWVEEILDLPQVREGAPVRRSSTASASSTPSTSGASGAHAQLKRLVQRVVEEAVALPALQHYASDEAASSFNASTYEDLLATAILNKVIERYQNESGSGGRSSGIHSASASPTPSSRSSPRANRNNTSLIRDEEEDVSDWEEGDDATDDTVELPRRIPFPEFGGDIVHTSDNADDEYEREADEVSSSDLQAVDGSWEENWLFQKKKIKTMQSVPVPMLVPNSNTEYRVLIGDRDADDTTDLSDAASDADEDGEYKGNIIRTLDSKMLIGGKNPLLELELATEDQTDSTSNVNSEFVYVKGKSLDNYEGQKESTSAKQEAKTENDSVIVVSIDSGPLSKAEFAVDEIHRSNQHDNIVVEHDDVFDTQDTKNSLTNHQREGEYEETIAKPVQRHTDSLRRQHYPENQYDTNRNGTVLEETLSMEEELIPGSVADRERKKWLNYVEMPNNPYSAEAIQKRLNAKSTSALFDVLTTKKNDLNLSSKSAIDDEKLIKNDTNKENNKVKESKTPDKPESKTPDKPESFSPKILKDVLAEQVPQYKRYGRDYYINEAKKSAGSRKRNEYSSTSSLSSVHKSSSLDNFETEFASPVSASSSLSDLEAAALHQNIVRAVLNHRNASPNFAINPIYENLDTTSNQDDEATNNRARRLNNKNNNNAVSHITQSLRSGGDGYVENEDIVRLKIPKKPETTEEIFETFNDVRRSNTIRSDQCGVRPRRRPKLNYTFGGSLRYNKSFHTDLW